MRSILQRGPLAGALEWRTPSRASVEELCCVHDRAYLESIVADSEAGGRRYGASTVLPPGGWLEVHPQAVSVDEHGYYKVDYSALRQLDAAAA